MKDIYGEDDFEEYLVNVLGVSEPNLEQDRGMYKDRNVELMWHIWVDGISYGFDAGANWRSKVETTRRNMGAWK